MAPSGALAMLTAIKLPRVQSAELFQGIRPYDRSLLSRDVVAGITLAALAIPEVMGYTKIAGTPVITGLYTILLPAVAFALLGSSRHLVVGGDSATAAILYAGIAGLGVAGLHPGTNQWLAYASLAALVTGGQTLVELARQLRQRNVVFALAEVQDAVRPELDRFGLTELIGSEHYYATLDDAIAAFEAAGARS